MTYKVGSIVRHRMNPKLYEGTIQKIFNNYESSYYKVMWNVDGETLHTIHNHTLLLPFKPTNIKEML